ncbi:MAG TPA: Rieske 2Fe-2S domain-containing protein [Candidatus Polarisedimenticolaceae bacterium]|nr:Rieske 2Fe-2S domain-containing protein [Candidatus Polarisedimenticolaceae bacterium]
MEITVYLSILFLVLYLVSLCIHRYSFVRDKGRMRDESRDGARVISQVEDLSPGSVKKFWIICQNHRVDGFLMNERGNFHAYVNRCRHMPTPLDFIRDQFVSDDGKYLMCYTHGALYEFATGLCVDGPCKGQALYRLPVRVDRGEVLVGCPEGDLSYLKE